MENGELLLIAVMNDKMKKLTLLVDNLDMTLDVKFCIHIRFNN